MASCYPWQLSLLSLFLSNSMSQEKSSLYRPQAGIQAQPQDEGAVIQLGALPFRFFTMVAFCVVLVVLGFLIWGQYAATERVQGILVPKGGVIKVHSPTPGLVVNLKVAEGDTVVKNQPLFSVQSPQSIGAFADYTDAIISELEDAIDYQHQQLEIKKTISQNEQKQIAGLINSLQDQLLSVEKQLSNHTEHQQLLDKEADALKVAMTKSEGVASKFSYQQKERERLAGAMQLQSSHRQKSEIQGQLLELRAQLEKLPMTHSLSQIQIQDRVSQLKQQLVRMQVAKGYQVISPTDGIIATILLNEGEHTTEGLPVLTVLPDDNELIVELYVPSQASGFLRLNQEVLIKYRAFPYQKFGVHKGTIAEISKTIIDPRDVKVPLPLPEATYRVRVKLNKQTVRSFGNEVALRSGMLVDAEIVRDRRTILEWVLEPLYSIRGRNQ